MGVSMELDFREAVELMKKGKEEGFNRLYSATYNKVFFRAKECTKSEEDALDLVQITYIEAFKNIDKLQVPEAVLTWLYTICYNQACKMYRNEREKREYLLSEESEGAFEIVESTDISTMPELSADQKATADIIRRIIEELPELQRMTVIAFYFDNVKLDQISEMMDCSVNTVKSRLNYARKYIKDRVEEKEKKEGYKLHVFALPTFILAIRLLAQETVMDTYTATAVYGRCCESLGIIPGTLSFEGIDNTAGKEYIEAAVESVVSNGAKISATKIGAVIAALVIGGGAIAGGIALSQNNKNQNMPSAIVSSQAGISATEPDIDSIEQIDMETIAENFAISAQAWKEPIGACYIDDADDDGMPEIYQLTAKNNPLSTVQVWTYKGENQAEICVFKSAYLKHLWGHKGQNRITYSLDHTSEGKRIYQVLTLDLSSVDNEPEIILSYTNDAGSAGGESYVPSEDMYELFPLDDVSKEGILKYIEENISKNTKY